jgi:hypothetical protein
LISQSEVEPRETVLRRLIRKAEFDRAVLFASLVRVWSLITGPLTILFIVRWLTLEVQGFYYTFASLLALQTFIELGFSIVVTNVASHEWSRLSLDDAGHIVGDSLARSRLISLGRQVFKWYGIASILFVVLVGTIGYFFLLNSKSSSLVDWKTPWLVLVTLSGLLLFMLPFNALLEACGQVEAVQRFRLGQSVLGTVGLWMALALGAGLWVTVLSMLIFVLRDIYLIFFQYRRFFLSFVEISEGPCVDWRLEVWPMQWRLGLSGLVTYFTFSLFVPVMFRYHGSAVAGRMGLTLAVVNGLQAVALSSAQTKIPRFGGLVAKKDFRTLDQLFYRVVCLSLLVYGCCALPLWALIFALNAGGHPLAGRILSPWPAGLFLLSSLFVQLTCYMTYYFRAHRQEPILFLSVTSSVAMGILVWLLGSRFGPAGAGACYLVVYTASAAWEFVIWVRFRAKWHGSST